MSRDLIKTSRAKRMNRNRLAKALRDKDYNFGQKVVRLKKKSEEQRGGSKNLLKDTEIIE